MIGSGWLFASMYAAQIAGPAAVFSWVIGGGISIALALVYAELGGMLPVAGAIARIPHFSHGSICSFFAGWLCWVAYVTTAPIEVTAVLDYSSNYLPWLTMTEHGERVLSTEGILVAGVLMLVFVGINLLAVKWLAHANTTITFWKLAVPFIAPIILIAVGFRSGNFVDIGGFAPNGIAGVFGAVSSGGVMFSLFGFRTAIDMAGEAKNPQRTVPLAMIGAVVISLAIYILLQVAFIGVIPIDHLKDGWHQISENVPGGPFAAFASILGLQWLALALYIDAVISPSGTGLAYTGVTARINYAMSRNGQIPRIFEKLNRFRVPVWSLLFNFVVGMIIFLPFPGWSELVGFISASVVLSFAFGPVTLAALRYQIPELQRPFHLPYGIVFSAIAFIFVGFVVYWTGWETNWKVFLTVLIGLIVLTLTRITSSETSEPLNLKESIWIWPYIFGLGAISYLGSYGKGQGLISEGLAMVVIAIFSLAIFVLALKLRLPDEQARSLVSKEEK
jgi:amino acid transporter